MCGIKGTPKRTRWIRQSFVRRFALAQFCWTFFGPHELAAMGCGASSSQVQVLKGRVRCFCSSWLPSKTRGPTHQDHNGAIRWPSAAGDARLAQCLEVHASMPRTSLQVLDEQMAMETLRRIRPKSQAAPCRSYAACVGVSSFSRRLAGGIGTEISGDLGRK